MGQYLASTTDWCPDESASFQRKAAIDHELLAGDKIRLGAAEPLDRFAEPDDIANAIVFLSARRRCRNGYATAAVSVSIPRYRVSPDVEANYVGPLLRATAAVSRILGYKPAPMPEKARSV